ncbi:hypothetical protein LDENG_00234580 [Lucifuga dentata]|nr:hypothetical protein LDENG_00234580 [Lucifuga dentata]
MVISLNQTVSCVKCPRMLCVIFESYFYVNSGIMDESDENLEGVSCFVISSFQETFSCLFFLINIYFVIFL